jgi:DNA-binding transcriptional LysR family regulator
MPSSLDDMAVFAAVAREGTLTAAARSLGITKQSVSERIAQLERRMGVQLLLRSTRALRLTEVGARYYESCTSILAEVERAERDARHSQQNPVGAVRVTAPIGLGAALMMPTVREFQRTYPDVRLELVLDERIVDLIRDGIDLAVRAGSVRSTPSFIARSLFETANAVVASPEYISTHGRPRSARALERLPCIARRQADTWLVDGEKIAIAGSVVVNTFEAARDAALSGIGIANIPIPVVLDDLRSGRLELVFGPTARIKFTALWPARRLPLRVRLFLDLLILRAREFGPASDAVIASIARQNRHTSGIAERDARSQRRIPEQLSSIIQTDIERTNAASDSSFFAPDRKL